MDGIIAGMGEVLWDVLPEGKKLGGAPANFAYHIAQFGFGSTVLSAVGTDDLGDEALAILRGKGLAGEIERVAYPTGTVQVTLDEAGIPCYDIREQAAWDHIPFTARIEELARHTRCVCFGSLAQRSPVSRATIGRFLDTMPDGADRYKVFDINLRQHFYSKEVIEASLRRCNILKINDEELLLIERMFGLDTGDAGRTCRTLTERHGLRMLILTCGTAGSYVFSDGKVSFLETPKVKVADTVGAGDSFTATFCASLLGGLSLREAHRLAVDVSAYVCTQAGAMPELPDELVKRLKR